MQHHLQRQFVAEFLRSESRSLAAEAARRLIEARPDIAARYSPLPGMKWREHFEGRIEDLAAAVAAGTPEILGAQVAWAKVTFSCRGAPAEDLAASLEVLGEVVPARLPPEDRELARSYLREAMVRLAAPSPTPPTFLSDELPHGDLAARYLLAVLQGERTHACDLLRSAVHAGVPLREIYDGVLCPVLREVGRMWHLGEITVAEEHLASTTTLMAMSRLAEHLPRKEPNGRTLLAACVQGNAHEIGLRMIADHFEVEGWRSVYLGANVPADDLVLAVQDFAPDLIALSAMICTQVQPLADTIDAIRAMPSTTPIVVGGGAFTNCPSLWRNLGADAYAATPADALTVANRLVGLPPE